MAQVIDTLVLELGLDPTKFTQGQREAMEALRKMQGQLEQGGKEAEAQGQKIENFFTGLKRQALGFGAALLGGRGAKEFVEYITTVDASAGRLSKTLNMSTQELSAWQNVFVQTGGTMESANATLQGLTDQINKFALTGQSDLLPIFNTLNVSMKDSQGHLKTAGQLLKDINASVQGMDPSRARALLMMMGMDSSAINVMIASNQQLEKMLANQRNLSQITEEDAQAAQNLATAWHETEAAATQLGRTLTTCLSPALVQFLNRWRDVLSENAKGYIVSPNSWLGRVIGMKPIPESDKPDGAKPSLMARIGSAVDRHGTEQYIREAALKRGIDPEVAVAVARSEGLNSYAGDDNSSFGPFQLHYGGVSRMKGMGGSGLGDVFTRQTGLDARDPATTRQQIDFSLDQAKKGGWGPWHGWRGLPRAGLDVGPNMAGEGSGGTTINNTTNIGDVVLNTKAENGSDAAKDFKTWMANQNTVSSANQGLR